MTTFRMFAFCCAVLVTAFLFRVFAYGLSTPQHDAGHTSHFSMADKPVSLPGPS
jgi:hypothetical protein